MPKATPPLESCPDCGHLVSAKAKVCPKCGCPFEDEPAPRPTAGVKKGIGCCGLIALAGALGVGGFMILVIIGMIQSAGKGPRPKPVEATPPAPSATAATSSDAAPVSQPQGAGVPPAFEPGTILELAGDETGKLSIAATEEILNAKRAGQGGFRPGTDLFGGSPGVPARVIGGRGDKLEVLVLADGWKDRTGWVSADQVRKMPTPEEMAADVVDELPQDRRRQLYRKLYEAGMQATRETDQRFGDEISERRSSFYEARRKDLRGDIARHDLVTPSVLDRIEEEGMKRHWPLEDYSSAIK